MWSEHHPALLDGEGLAEILPVLLVPDLHGVQVEVQPDHVGLAVGAAIAVELLVVRLLAGAAVAEAKLAGA